MNKVMSKPKTSKLVLASTSPFRAALLDNAGMTFEKQAPRIDERAIEESLKDAGLDGADLATILATAKAQDVSASHPDGYIIGGDQTLTLHGEQFHKPKDMEAARRHLLKLSGQTHQLNSAITLVLNGEIVWEHVGVAHMTMRELDPGFVGRHLSSVGDAALTSVGAYQLEGMGVQLFDKIDGDYFTILGLPLIPLLAQLRKFGVIDG
jgi:septum formation protein